MTTEEQLNIREKENFDLLLKTLDQDEKYKKLKEINAEQKKVLGDDYLFEKICNPEFRSKMELLCPECREKIEKCIVF